MEAGQLTSISGRSHRFSLSCSASAEVFSAHDALRARAHNKTATEVFMFTFLPEGVSTKLSVKLEIFQRSEK